MHDWKPFKRPQKTLPKRILALTHPNENESPECAHAHCRGLIEVAMSTAAIKYPEFILAISTDHVRAMFAEGFVPRSDLQISPLFQSGIAIRQRQWLDLVDNSTREADFDTLRAAEGAKPALPPLRKFLKWLKKIAKRFALPFSTKVGDELYRQLLPYVTIRNGDLILPYLRGKAVGEKRLAGNASVGWGGHIDAIDLVWDENSVLDVKATILKNIRRELGEEMRFFRIGEEEGDIPLDEAGELSFNGFINDTSNEVGRLHLGLSFDFNIKPGYGATSREAELRVLPWQSKEDLCSMPEVVIESWSGLYLASR